MKTRNGFVSNSSSSSFLIGKYLLSKSQIIGIWNHLNIAEDLDLPFAHSSNRWDISEDEVFIRGYTTMDNFDMKSYMEDFLKIDPEHITWEEDN